jgi:hypothetical protein
MKDILMCVGQKGNYESPTLDIFFLQYPKDILCMSTDKNDNDFDASGLGNFTNGNQ